MQNSPIRLLSTSSSGFTLVEVLVAILIFGLGLISAFALSSSANSLSMRSKQEIIATNLLREQLELFKNIRDTNFLALRDFDSLRGVNPTCVASACKIEFWYAAVGTKYTIGAPPVYYVKNIFTTPTNVLNGDMPDGIRAHQAMVSIESKKILGTTTFRYCLDAYGRYRLDCDSTMKPTPYYGFILVQPLTTQGSSTPTFTVNAAFRVTAYFATTEGGYREIPMSTIITDFKK